MNILFTNAGRRTYMIQYALDLKLDGEDVKVFVGDYAFEAPAKHVSPETVSVFIPRVDTGEDAFAEAVLARAKEHEIELVIPLSDFELMSLARHKQEFLDAGIILAVSDTSVIANTMNKENAFRHCLLHGIPTPHTMFSLDSFDGIFPCTVKPLEGSGGNGFRFVTNDDQLASFEEGRDMIQHFIDGPEYGIDIFNDLNGKFIKATAKRKLMMRAGETDRAEIVDLPELIALSKKISEAFGHCSNLDIDVIYDSEGQPQCVDFNARFGGGYPITHEAGMNYLAALVAIVRGRPPVLPAKPRHIAVSKGLSIHVIELDT